MSNIETQKKWLFLVVIQILILVIFSPIYLKSVGLIPGSIFQVGQKFHGLAFYYGFIFSGPIILLSLIVFYKCFTGLLQRKYQTPKIRLLVKISLVLSLIMLIPLISILWHA